MAELHLWMQGWSDQGERILVKVENVDKVERLTSATSALSAMQKISLTSCTATMVERMQEQEGDNRIVAKSKRTTMNLAFSVSTRSPSVHSPIAPKSPGVLKASSRQLGCSGKPDAKRK